ncbi:MAG: DUF5012 domain-containing protein [Tannerella sp.]|nr:DUF5012 domain-containing protein [Tannerella sp.]
MKKINKLLLMSGIATLLIFFNACINDEDKDSYGISKITFLPELNLVDEGKIYVVEKSVTFVEPGYAAFAGTDDITDAVTVKGTVDVNTAGMYLLEYIAVNPEGFSTTKTRNVFVADLNNPFAGDLSGAYTSSIVRVAGSASSSRGPYTVYLDKLAEGLYHVEDFLGGWYWVGSAYGTAYAYDGIILVHSDGSIDMKWSNTAVGWGDGARLYSPAYDAANSTFTWGAQMLDATTYIFNVTLVKQ